MQLSNSLTPRSVSSSNYLLRQYGGAAAAYSLQRLDTSVENVVRARRSTDDAEADFTAQEVSGGSLREFALNNDADLIRFADQAVAADKRMYFDGVNDEVRVTGMTASVDYFGACTIEATIYVEDTTATQVVWSLGSDCYRLVSISGQWRLNGATDTSVLVTSGLITIAVDYDASGQATELRIGGATAWTGTAPAGTTPTTIFYIGSRASGLYFKGLIYDFSLSGSSVKNFAFNGYGNTNADWEDQVGSNDGTVIGSPALFSGQGFDAYVTTLYDQSGNGRNALQATAASQPQIVADGVVVTGDNGLPEIRPDGTNDSLNLGNMSTWGISSATAFQVIRSDRTLNASQGFHGLANPFLGDRYTFTNGAAYDGSFSSTRQTFAVTDGVVSTDHLYTVLSKSAEWTARINGSQVFTTGTNTAAFSATARLFDSQSASLFFQGGMQEMVIYGSDQSSNYAAIEANIGSRYGITTGYADLYLEALQTAGASPTSTQANAIRNFVRTGESEGWFSSLKRFYLPIWGAAGPNAIDLISRASGTFNGSVTHGAGYVQGDGSTGYFDFGDTPSAIGLTLSSASMFFLSNQANSSVKVVSHLGSVDDAGGTIISEVIASSGGAVLSYRLAQSADANGNTSTVLSVSNQTGIIYTGRSGGERYIRRHTTAASSQLVTETEPDTGTIPTVSKVYAMARSFGGTPQFLSDARYGAYGAGTGIATADAANFTLALKNLWETTTGLTLP